MIQYEAMFLFDPTFATDFGAAKAEIERLFARAEAEVVFLEKWEERKLAYEIKGRKRGVYVLTYFKCDGSRITAFERDAQLSEPILRVLVKNAEGVTRAQIDRFMPQVRRAEEAARDGDKPGGAKPDAAKPDAAPAKDAGTAKSPDSAKDAPKPADATADAATPAAVAVVEPPAADAEKPSAEE